MIDVDINDRSLPKPCQTPGCSYDRYHACIFGRPDLFPQLLGRYNPKRKGRTGFGTEPRSDAWRKGVTAAQQARWKNYYEINAERDKAMIQRYEAGFSIRQVAKHFGISSGAVQNAFRRLSAEGRVTIRSRGRYNTLAQSA